MHESRHAAKPPASLTPVAKLAGLVRSPDFLDGLGEVLATYFPGISYAAFHFSARGRPAILAHNLDATRHQRVLIPYIERMYLLDPIFQHWERHRARGVWSLDELAPAGFRDSDYFATYYRELGLNDEAGAFFPLTEHECLSLSFGFYRPLATPAPDDVLAVLTYLFPLLESLIGQFWLASSLHLPSIDDQAPSQLHDFGRDVLSDRERDVAWLILRGYSSPEIARQLGITQGTVKNHRKRLYSRLNISSQGELFRQFMLFQQPHS